MALAASVGTTRLLQFIQRQRDEAYGDFAGATFHGSIPLTESVINEILQVSAVGSSTVIRQLRVHLCEQNLIVATGTIHKWFLAKRFEIELWIEPEVDFVHAPRLRFWLPRTSLFGSIGHLLTTFGVLLPRGVHVTGRLVEIDLADILFQHNLPELVYWLKFLQIVVVHGRLVLSFVAQIDAPALLPAQDRK